LCRCGYEPIQESVELSRRLGEAEAQDLARAALGEAAKAGRLGWREGVEPLGRRHDVDAGQLQRYQRRRWDRQAKSEQGVETREAEMKGRPGGQGRFIAACFGLERQDSRMTRSGAHQHLM
jgi:hypothetical protein